MTTQIILARSDTTDALHIWDSGGSAFSNERTYDLASSPTCIALSPDNRYLAVGLADDTVIVYEFNNGDLGTPGAAYSTAATAGSLTFNPADTTLLLIDAESSGREVVRIGSDLGLTSVDTNSEDTGFTDAGSTWSSDGTYVACDGGGTGKLSLFSWNGSALSRVDQVTLGAVGTDKAIPQFIGSTTKMFVGNEGWTTIYLYDADGGTLTSVASTSFTQTNFGTQRASPDGTLVAAGRRSADGVGKLFSISDDTFTDLADFAEEMEYPAWFADSRHVAAVNRDGAYLTVRIYLWDGSTLSEVASVATALDATIVGFETSAGTPPPTIQTQFETTYADVSGRDPLPTALTSRDPARNLVNYLVGIYAGNNPRIVRKPVLIDYGELEKTSPAPPAGKLCREIWIRDPRDPNFKAGRRALILGRSGGADPGTVELTLFIADNAESFVEPS